MHAAGCGAVAAEPELCAAGLAESDEFRGFDDHADAQRCQCRGVECSAFRQIADREADVVEHHGMLPVGVRESGIQSLWGFGLRVEITAELFEFDRLRGGGAGQGGQAHQLVLPVDRIGYPIENILVEHTRVNQLAR